MHAQAPDRKQVARTLSLPLHDMRILVSGATGFVGRALIARLERDRHRVVAWVRSPERAADVLGTSVATLAMACSNQDLERQLGTCDAIVHLAGEPVIGKRWTPERKRALIDSRVGLANRLVAAMAKATPPPRVFVSASAVGYYGDRGDEILREASPPGTDFLAKLCDDWELAAEKAHEHGARVVCLRTGIVLGNEGGALAPLKKLFRLGLGGNLGSGTQFTSWIALEDLVEIYVRALVDSRMDGAYNATGPEPATNAKFTRALGKVLHRPTILPAPKFALRMILGEAASALLASQRVVPARLVESGFEFEHEDVRSALTAALRPRAVH
ncbi:MAG TPA: TIGR01777 family oxidoreductase [Planctomycetota bacterium]|nr:TIGR01777 family oxidoreductase [Planctomycetota bacterium]